MWRARQTLRTAREHGRSLARVWRALRSLGVVTGLAASMSCSLLVDTSPEQCKTNADCAQFPGARCVKKACIAPEGADCSTNQDCIDRNGEYWICRKRDMRCVGLLSDECTVVQGDWASDDAVVFGSVLPTTGSDASLGRPMENSVRLAVDEFDTLANGLPPVESGGAPRPLVLIGCTDESDTETALRAARHLTEQVQVPAIIGAAFSGITLDVATTVTIPQGVLLMSPSATSASITDLADDGLVWRTSPSDVLQTAALAKLVPILEGQVRAAVGLSPTESIKLAIVHKGDAYGVGLATALEAELVLNGKPPEDNGAAYERIDYGDPGASGGTDYPKAISRVLKMLPHIVLVVGTVEGIGSVLAPIEGQWPEVGYFPRYVLSDGLMLEELWDWVGKDDGLRQRILGTVPGTSSTQYTSFRQQYLSRFGQDPSPDVFGTAGSYDALYLLAYAAVASGEPTVTGRGLAEGLKRLVPDGTRIDAGGAQINQAYGALQAGENVDFQGASGPLDFDVDAGEAASDIQIWCLPKDAMGAATTAVHSGLYYDAALGVLQGKIACDGQ